VFWNLAGAHTNEAISARSSVTIAPLTRRRIGPAILMDERLCSHASTRSGSSARRWGSPARKRASWSAGASRLRALRRRSYRAEKKQRLAAILERLSTLGTQFSQNVLADESSYALDPRGRAGRSRRPAGLARRRDGTKPRAERGHAGRHAVTLSRSMVEPFLTFSTRRDLREDRLQRLGQARRERRRHRQPRHRRRDGQAAGERAKLLGYDDLRRLQARRHHGQDAGECPRAARAVWKPAVPRRARRRRRRSRRARPAEGENEPDPPWDWRFYAEKVRQKRLSPR
jgi:peptidyl-dipeptidase Dcp